MKKVFSMMFCFVAMASFCLTSCGDDDDDSGYSVKQIAGTWNVDKVSTDGTDMTDMMRMMIGDVSIKLNEDGTGKLIINGNEGDGFSWGIKGETLTIDIPNGKYDFTIKSLSEHECTFTGDDFPVPGMDMTVPNVEVKLVK